MSQRYSSQPPETTSSHPLIESRRRLRPSASVEPANILDESGQSVPPSFYGDEPIEPIKEADDPLHSHTLQHGLPEHLYGESVLHLICFVWGGGGAYSRFHLYLNFRVFRETVRRASFWRVTSQTSTSLVPRLSWEEKESLVTTACACAKISIFYRCAIHELVDHVVYHAYVPAKPELVLESC